MSSSHHSPIAALRDFAAATRHSPNAAAAVADLAELLALQLESFQAYAESEAGNLRAQLAAAVAPAPVDNSRQVAQLLALADRVQFNPKDAAAVADALRLVAGTLQRPCTDCAAQAGAAS